MRVYLSAMFSQKEVMKKRSEELAEAGVEPTSTWVGEDAKPSVQAHELPDHYLRHTAILDIHDMLRADKFVLFVPTDAEIEGVARRSLSRGGRNFETGFFYALIMLRSYLPPHIRSKQEILLVGQRESVFHFLFDMAPGADQAYGLILPQIKQFNTWADAYEYLTGVKYGSKVQGSDQVGQTEPAESTTQTT